MNFSIKTRSDLRPIRNPQHWLAYRNHIGKSFKLNLKIIDFILGYPEEMQTTDTGSDQFTEACRQIERIVKPRLEVIMP